MKRTLQLLALALFTGHLSIAQDLAHKIPEKALAVASIKSDQLLQLFSITEFDTSALGKRLLGKLSQKTNGNYESIKDLGFNLSSTIYYYNQKTDSISYNCFLIPLSDARKFETIMFNEAEHADIKHQGEIRILQTAGNRNLVMWNNEMLYVANGSTSAYFFEDSANASRYGIKALSYNDDYTTDTAATASSFYYDSVVEDSVPLAATIDLPADMIQIERPDSTTEMIEMKTDPSDEVVAVPEAAMDATEETAVEVEEDEYTRASKEQTHIKDSVASIWMLAYGHDVFSKNNTAASILNNPAYLRSVDKNAIGSFWLSDLQSIYASFLPYSLLKYGNMLNGYGSINARLYMGKDNMRITAEMGLDESKAAAYRKVYDQKLNKKFLKYIKSDSLIGFMSCAFNTESYLNELPSIFSQKLGIYSEEMELAGDMLSLMLDEKAIAKVVKGDALIVMTNISSKETTYSTYEYDENYERRDTVKTKTENIPDILCMFSSDDTQLIEKLLRYGVKKEKIQFANNIYSLAPSNKNPFALHMLMKDGIVFLGTSLNDIEQINSGTYKSNVSKQQQELLLDNNMTWFFSPKNLNSKVPGMKLGEISESVSSLLGRSGNVYLKSSGIKGNYISADLIADVPADQENALKYLFSLFNDFYKKD